MRVKRLGDVRLSVDWSLGLNQAQSCIEPWCLECSQEGPHFAWNELASPAWAAGASARSPSSTVQARSVFKQSS